MIDEGQLITELELEIGETYNSDICYGLKRAIEIVEHRPLVGEWIPCSERLPEKGRKVLLQTEGSQMTVAFLDKKLKWYVDSGDYFCTDLSAKPIAWRPLPEPYKGE